MSEPERISLIRPCTPQDVPLPVSGADEVLLATEPGKARACNLAARRSSGTILVFVDADTRVLGDLDWYRRRPEEEAFWVSPSRNTEWALWSRMGNAFFNTANRLPLFRRYPWAHGALIAVRRDAFWSIGGFDESAPMEDINLFARLFNARLRHAKSPVWSEQIRAISFPPRRMNTVKDGHSGRYLAQPMSLVPDATDRTFVSPRLPARDAGGVPK